MEKPQAVSLDESRARKFLRKLADESHLTIFVSTDGEVSIWSKDIDTTTLDRIKEVLSEVQEGH